MWTGGKSIATGAASGMETEKCQRRERLGRTRSSWYAWERIDPPERPLAHRAALVFAFAALSLAGQSSPRPNRVAWLAMLPDPLPDGAPALALEASSQFLRPDFERSGDGRSFARLDGEEWQVTADLPWKLGPGFLNLRLRAVNRSGGFLDQAFASWHSLLGVPQGGREQAPKYRIAYVLVRDGTTVARLERAQTRLLPLDLTWQAALGDHARGARIGIGLQAGARGDDFGGLGGTNGLVGGAAWMAWGRFRVHGQAERISLHPPADSPWRRVLERRQLSRAWAGVGWEGDGPGFFAGFGLDVSVGYTGSPYRLGIVRIDRAGWQQHWSFRHRRFPRWTFTFSEEAGTYNAPDITGALVYRFR